MGHRSRLVVVALTAALATVAVGVLGVVPVVNALRNRLQDRYDADAPFPEAARLAGTEYHAAALWSLVALAVLLFCAGAARVAATTPPPHRAAVPRELGRLGAGLLLVQTPLSVAAGLSGAYSPAVTLGGLVLGAAGAGVLWSERAPGWAHVLACVLAAAATLVLARPAVLLLPVTTGVTGLLLAAAVTRSLELRAAAGPVRR